MTTMEALVMHAVGEPADVLRLETRPVPEPDAGQVPEAPGHGAKPLLGLGDA